MLYFLCNMHVVFSVYKPIALSTFLDSKGDYFLFSCNVCASRCLLTSPHVALNIFYITLSSVPTFLYQKAVSLLPHQYLSAFCHVLFWGQDL